MMSLLILNVFLFNFFMCLSRVDKCNAIYGAPPLPVDTCKFGKWNQNPWSSKYVCTDNQDESTVSLVQYTNGDCKGEGVQHTSNYKAKCHHETSCQYSEVKTISECNNPSSFHYSFAVEPIVTDTCFVNDKDQYTFCNESGIFISYFTTNDASCNWTNIVKTEALHKNQPCTTLSNIEVEVTCDKKAFDGTDSEFDEVIVKRVVGNATLTFVIIVAGCCGIIAVLKLLTKNK